MPAHGAENPVPAGPATSRTPLAMVSEHLTLEFPGVVRDLDVDRGQAAVVPPGFSARVHRHAPLRCGFARHY